MPFPLLIGGPIGRSRTISSTPIALPPVFSFYPPCLCLEPVYLFFILRRIISVFSSIFLCVFFFFFFFFFFFQALRLLAIRLFFGSCCPPIINVDFDNVSSFDFLHQRRGCVFPCARFLVERYQKSSPFYGCGLFPDTLPYSENSSVGAVPQNVFSPTRTKHPTQNPSALSRPPVTVPSFVGFGFLGGSTYLYF